MIAQLESTKQIVRDFYDLAFNQRKPEEATEKFMGPYYRQHNPQAPDGAEGLIGFVHYFEKTFPDFRVEIKRMIAEGDLVAVHSRLVRHATDRGQAVADFFRLENGKIVEHWDVLQEVPETAAYDNSMF